MGPRPFQQFGQHSSGEIVWQIFAFNLIVKYAISLISIPLIYLRSGRKRTEATLF